MLGSLAGFVEELRAVGVPISMVEVLDAADALTHADLSSPEMLHAALGATLVKSARYQRVFDSTFDVFFGFRLPPVAPPEGDERPAGAPSSAAGSAAGESVEDLMDALASALAEGADVELRRLLGRAVERLAGIEPGRPVGGRYYLYRVMRRIDLDRLRTMLNDLLPMAAGDDPLHMRLQDEQVERLIVALRAAVRGEIMRRLVADRGPEAVAATLRSPLVEDRDLMHATRAEIEEIERAVAPLARKLATRLARRRRRGRRGRLDVRRTIRRSLAHGGALLDPQFRPPRLSKPEIVLLCDVSGSMATFARFTMQLTYAISGELSKVRSFAFVDGLDEVTGYFSPDVGFGDGLARMTAEANVVRGDGHSDYGRAFADFHVDYPLAVTPRTTVIVTGDSRNNYRDTGVQYLEHFARKARALIWLNPEAKRYWDTGDSIIGTYAPFCDSVEQVSTLRQLEGFVERIALPRTRSLAVASVSA